nr:MAG TPA: hypothetical protein [Caudoviricetes sp.]
MKRCMDGLKSHICSFLIRLKKKPHVPRLNVRKRLLSLIQ